MKTLAAIGLCLFILGFMLSGGYYLLAFLDELLSNTGLAPIVKTGISLIVCGFLCFVIGFIYLIAQEARKPKSD